MDEHTLGARGTCLEPVPGRFIAALSTPHHDIDIKLGGHVAPVGVAHEDDAVDQTALVHGVDGVLGHHLAIQIHKLLRDVRPKAFPGAGSQDDASRNSHLSSIRITRLVYAIGRVNTPPRRRLYSERNTRHLADFRRRHLQETIKLCSDALRCGTWVGVDRRCDLLQPVIRIAFPGTLQQRL